MPLKTTCRSQAIVYTVGIALNNLYSNKCQLFCTHAWSPGGKGVVYLQAVNPANIAKMNCNRKRKSRGKWIVYATIF